jgi:hypothetical protein
MKSTKLLGIWMDHSIAHLTAITNDNFVTKTIESKPKLQVNEEDLYYKDESHTLNKEQNNLSVYYRKLGDTILDYEEVVLFGPTDAKNELINSLKDNPLFGNIKIGVKTADKMTEYQQHAFIKEYFRITE